MSGKAPNLLTRARRVPLSLVRNIFTQQGNQPPYKTLSPPQGLVFKPHGYYKYIEWSLHKLLCTFSVTNRCRLQGQIQDFHLGGGGAKDYVRAHTITSANREVLNRALGALAVFYLIRPEGPDELMPWCSVRPSVHSFQNASSSSFLNRFWFWFFHKIGLGGGFKTSTQNCEIHYLW